MTATPTTKKMTTAEMTPPITGKKSSGKRPAPKIKTPKQTIQQTHVFMKKDNERRKTIKVGLYIFF